jgi:hypothetical protein
MTFMVKEGSSALPRLKNEMIPATVKTTIK